MVIAGQQLPHRVELDHDVHLVADGSANLLERRQRGLKIRCGDIVPVAFFRRDVERPDLHRRDALGEKLRGELAGPVQEGVEIVVLAICAQSPVCRVLALGRAHVGCTGAGVVGADALT